MLQDKNKKHLNIWLIFVPNPQTDQSALNGKKHINVQLKRNSKLKLPAFSPSLRPGPQQPTLPSLWSVLGLAMMA